jgi:hypothetical protein
MGWKSVKEHYQIGHYVTVDRDKGICIGSPYVHDLIVIGFDGVVKKPPARTHNDELDRYLREFDADRELLKKLVTQEDKFEKSLPVWTYFGSRIVEKFCEEYGWPNVTHDGLMMYANTFSKDRAVIVRAAYANAKAGHELTGDRVEQARKELEEIEARNSEYFRDMCRLVELARSESIDLNAEDDGEGDETADDQ